MNCVVAECDRPVLVKSRGLCSGHYQRWLKRGTVDESPVRHRLPNGAGPETVLSKFSGVRDDNDCIPWEGVLYPNGYGNIHVPGRGTRYAHRIAWEVANGQELGPADVVRHRCDNRRCVNPVHLEIGDQKDNMADMVSRGRDCHGVRNVSHKLTDDAVREIRRRVAGGEMQKSVAEDFRISRSQVCLIVKGDAWRHVTPTR